MVLRHDYRRLGDLDLQDLARQIRADCPSHVLQHIKKSHLRKVHRSPTEELVDQFAALRVSGAMDWN
jgi:hypothetical protein